MHAIWTIGYENATPPGLLAALQEAGIDLLVDVRAIANSRRPGFSKSRLAESLRAGGIHYLHLRGLGTPGDGRAAARAGRFAELQAIYQRHLETPEAQDDLETLAELLHAGRRVCLLCLEADPAHCHRSMVAAALEARFPLEVTHLTAGIGEADEERP
jgi:uncharacterized protein (DUF488 family)